MTRTPSRVLTVPGWTNSGLGHRQTLWERAVPRRFRRVEQRDWDTPRPDEWIGEMDAAIAAERASVVLVAHSLGASPSRSGRRGPRRPEWARCSSPPRTWSAPTRPSPSAALPRPAAAAPLPQHLRRQQQRRVLSIDCAEHFACCWASELVPIGAAGHVNAAAGFGPWPAGERLLGALCREGEAD